MLSRAPILAFILGSATALGTAADAQTPGTTTGAPLSVLSVPSGGRPPALAPPFAPRSTEDANPIQRLSRISPISPIPRIDPRAVGDLAPRLDPLATLTSGLGVHVRDLDTAEVLYDHHGDRPQNPASSHKLVTAAAALELLGPEYRFETRLTRAGDTLYLVGEGDPTLLLDDLHQLASDLVASPRCEGLRRIVVDDTAFSPRQFGPGFETDGDAAYLAPSSATSLQFNTVEVVVTPNEYGPGASVRLDPPSSGVRLVNHATTGLGPTLRVHTRAEGSITVVEVSGSIAAGHPPVIERRRVVNPATFTGGALAQILADLTDQPPLPVRRGRAPDLAPVATHRSAPLTTVLAAALKFSNNFTAEQIFRTVGWRHTGEPGDWDNGLATVRTWWSAIGGDPMGLVFNNGSGLNRNGKATARSLVDVLARAAHAPEIGLALFSALPAAGRDGTLHKRMEGAHGRIRAKTGTMNGVSTLTGVVVSSDGRRRIGFSILMGRVEDTLRARELQDRLAMQLLEYADRSGA